MSDIQPVTLLNPPNMINTCMWIWCEGGVGCTRCRAMSAALAPSPCNQGFGRCAHQLSERAYAPSPCLNINHEPLETKHSTRTMHVQECLQSLVVPGFGLACVCPLTSMMGRRCCAAVCGGLLDGARDVRGDHVSNVVDAWFCC
jgi:hypothetical protein